MAIVSRKRALEVINYYVNKGENQTLRHFKISAESLHRYRRALVQTKIIKKLVLPKVLLLDIETAPMLGYFWGLRDQNISIDAIEEDWFMLCWSAKWLFDNKIMSDIVTPKEAIALDDKRILRPVWDLVEDAQVIIGHNLQNFDMKCLRTRWKYHRFKPPMPYQIIDTLLHSRRSFRLPSHKQDYITKWLHLPQKKKTNLKLWIDCKHGVKKALDYMAKYNRQDVTGLEELYMEYRPWMKSHPNMNVYVDTDKKICPTCGNGDLSWKGFYHTPAGKYKAFRCSKCGAIGRSRFSELTQAKRNHVVIGVAR